MTEAKMTDGWIEWKGGERPVGAIDVIDARLASGKIMRGRTAGALAWNHMDTNSDVIAYRLHKPEPQTPEDPVGTVLEVPQTIEQLAADYRAKLAIAKQAQEEADSHRCGAEAAWSMLELAGKAIGLVIGIAGYELNEPKIEPNEPLNITDWRDLQVGDEVEITSVFSRGRNEGYEHLIGETATVRFVGDPSMQSLEVSHNSVARYIDGFKFIRRP